MTKTEILRVDSRYSKKLKGDYLNFLKNPYNDMEIDLKQKKTYTKQPSLVDFTRLLAEDNKLINSTSRIDKRKISNTVPGRKGLA